MYKLLALSWRDDSCDYAYACDLSLTVYGSITTYLWLSDNKGFSKQGAQRPWAFLQRLLSVYMTAPFCKNKSTGVINSWYSWVYY